MCLKKFVAILPVLCVCNFCAAAESLVIVSDGNYVSNEVLSVRNPDVLYEISGKFVLENAKAGQESYVQIGLVPYGVDGRNLNEISDFPMPLENSDNGFILVDFFVFGENISHGYARQIKLGGSELAQVSIVVGALLADGAKLTVEDLKILPIEASQIASRSSGGSASAKSSAGAFDNAGEKSLSLRTNFPFAELASPDESMGANGSALGASSRAIYVNSEIGSDNFAGLRKTRGQADGPKKTLKSAVSSASNGDFIVLQETNTPYAVSSIRPRAGQSLKIRAAGKAVLTSR